MLPSRKIYCHCWQFSHNLQTAESLKKHRNKVTEFYNKKTRKEPNFQSSGESKIVIKIFINCSMMICLSIKKLRGIEAFEISRWFTFMRLCLRKSLRPTSSLSTACDCLWHHWQTFPSSARLSFPLSLRSFAFNIYHWLLMFSVSNQPGASVHGYWFMTIGYNTTF